MSTKFSEDVIPLVDLKTNPGRVMKHVSDTRRPVLLTSRGITTVRPFSLREKARMRGYEIKQLSCFDLLTLTLSAIAPCIALPPTSLSASRWERGLMGQQ